MRQADVYVLSHFAGILTETDEKHYTFDYDPAYAGPPVSLTMPIVITHYEFHTFPSFFDGLLPEGVMLDALLKQAKLDRHDYFCQLITVGEDVVGAVSLKARQT